MSAAIAPQQFTAMPHRKPLPTGAAYPSGVTGNDQIYTRQASHTHSRSASSSAMPSAPYAAQYNPQTQPEMTTRRTLSNATSSTASSTNIGQPVNRAASNTSYGSSVRRSTSSRSQQPTTSYVALLRRQKATVWCDRAQHEDPRVLAQQRQAKMRANMEVVGGVNATARVSTSTSGSGGVRAKIRHHGAVKASAFQSGNMSGAGVPMRLSASEVDDGDSDDDKLRGTRYHQREGSGRSSLSSGHRASLPAVAANPLQGRYSSGSTPPSRNSYSPSASVDPYLRNPEDTPVPGTYQGQDYFAQPAHDGKGTSGGSGSSEERGFGEASRLPAKVVDEPRRKTSEELRRRGSVDDRTMTMSGVRLFVANPDLSD